MTTIALSNNIATGYKAVYIPLFGMHSWCNAQQITEVLATLNQVINLVCGVVAVVLILSL